MRTIDIDQGNVLTLRLRKPSSSLLALTCLVPLLSPVAMPLSFAFAEPSTRPATPCGRSELPRRFGASRGWVIGEALEGHESREPQYAIWLRGPLKVDPRGAPNAYCEDDKGLDYNKNAGYPKGNWKKILWGELGAKKAKLQSGAGDEPQAGCFISMTTLGHEDIPVDKPGRYIDATKIPYIALPKWFADRKPLGLQIGDVAAVVLSAPGGKSRTAYAIWAIADDESKLGRGSIALAEALGLRSSPINGGTEENAIDYLLFPGSGTGKPLPREEIERRGAEHLRAWGGESHLARCK